MSHRHIQKHLSEYLDDKLSAQEREKVESHLRTCDECNEILSDLKQNKALIKELRQPTPSGIWKAVQEQILDERQFNHRERAMHIWQYRFFRPLCAGVSIIVVACLIAGIFHFYPVQKPIEDPLDLYVMVHTGYTYQAFEVQNGEADELLSASNGADSESDLPEDTQLFLDAYLSSF